MGAATTAKWAPLEKGSKAYVQSVWLNAEKKEIGVEPKGRTFFLTFPLIGLFRFCVPVQTVDATPSGIKLFSKVVFMRPGRRFGLSAEQKCDVWRRWKAGQTLHEIGRAFGKDHNSIRGVVARHGGMVPAVRRRALLALTLREREEISRGLASGSSFREIAKCLERAVSTVSREVAASWWPSCVSSQSSGRRSLAVGLAAQALPSFHQPEVAEHRCE